MSVSVKQFLHQLTHSGVMAADEITAFQASHTAETGEDLAKSLIRQKKLTKYQVQRIFKGKSKGLVLGNYVILDTIGAGGMGQVYLAEHRRMGRRVALKTLPEAVAKDKQTLKRFQKEVRAAAKLSHPNIVTSYDADEADGIHFLVMERVEGIDLSQLVKKDGPLSVERSVDYVLQAARGLEYAHAEGVVHRDIKPANMLLNKKGAVKILDMGLARIDSLDDDNAENGLTATGMVMGTVDYMAPEQALDTKQADARSDIYSLGCVLHFLLTGKSLYSGDTMIKKILAHRDEPIPSLSASQAKVPDVVDVVFQKMVAKNSGDRQQTMSQVISELNACGVLETSASTSAATTSNDPAFDKFLNDQAAISTPTVVQKSAEMAPAFGKQETMPSGYLDETLITGNVLPTRIKPRPQTSGLKVWGIAAACLLGIAGLIWMSGILIKVDTAAGTIIVEIDQPELAGAVVSVDGQKKITIKTVGDEQPIEVVGDEKTHTLKVTKGGFETFVKEFTVKAGSKQTIRVRLEPLVVMVKKKSPSPSSSGDNWALEFDGVDDYVEIPTLKYDGESPVTLEVEVVPDREQLGTMLSYSGKTFRVVCSNQGSPGRPLVWQWDVHPESSVNESYQVRAEAEPGRADFLAAGYDGKSMTLYVNGNRQATDAVWIQENGDLRDGLPGERPIKKINSRVGTRIAWQGYKGNFFKGRIHRIRISNVVRYTTDFKPEKRFENDEHTLALYHFDEGSGDVLKDSSGNGHDGKIVGATWMKVDDELKVITPTMSTNVRGEPPSILSPQAPKTAHAWPEDQPAPAIAPFDTEQAKAHQQQWAKHLNTEVEITNSIGMKLQIIPPGEFLMGSSAEEMEKLFEEEKARASNAVYEQWLHREGPQHTVVLTQPVRVSMNEVTRGQFKHFVDDTGYSTDAEQNRDGGLGYEAGKVVASPKFLWNTDLGFETEQTDNHPAVNISWNDAAAFCEWLSKKEGVTYRLPTEAQWEFACRAGSLTRYCFGDANERLEQWGGLVSEGPKPIGLKRPNAFGLFDLHGNVSEWCDNQLPAYTATPTVDPVGSVEEKKRAFRGGCYIYSPWISRSAFRSAFLPTVRTHYTGFRIVQTFEKLEDESQ